MKLTRSTRRKTKTLVDVARPRSVGAVKHAGHPAEVDVSFGSGEDGADYTLRMTPGEAELLADRLKKYVEKAREMDGPMLTLFGSLRIGERFRFPGEEIAHVKLCDGGFHTELAGGMVSVAKPCSDGATVHKLAPA